MERDRGGDQPLSTTMSERDARYFARHYLEAMWNYNADYAGELFSMPYKSDMVVIESTPAGPDRSGLPARSREMGFEVTRLENMGELATPPIRIDIIDIQSETLAIEELSPEDREIYGRKLMEARGDTDPMTVIDITHVAAVTATIWRFTNEGVAARLSATHLYIDGVNIVRATNNLMVSAELDEASIGFENRFAEISYEEVLDVTAALEQAGFMKKGKTDELCRQLGIRN